MRKPQNRMKRLVLSAMFASILGMGKEFWHTWHLRGPEELNSPEFKAELDEVVEQLRESVLQDLSSMRSYCYSHGGEIEGGICTQNYGYTVETDRYRYLLRCNPIEGDYQLPFIMLSSFIDR